MILGKLASGGMGEVWLARQSGPGGFAKTVVIKTIAEKFAGERGFLEMFFDEARLAALINHPNVVQIFDFGDDRGRHYFAMEYLEGRSLTHIARQFAARSQSLPPSVAARVASDCLAGLDHAHDLKTVEGRSLGLVHRDVSPDNIFVTYSGQVKLLDFGIARAADRTHHTAPGTAKGKTYYFAPEQIRAGLYDRRADLWAMGVTLYAMLTRTYPFDGEGVADVLRTVVTDPVRPPSALREDLPQPLEKVILRALEKDPALRYPTAGAMRIDVERYLETVPQISGFQLAAIMEDLFPAGSDELRRKLSAIAGGLRAAASAGPEEKTGEPTRPLGARSRQGGPTELHDDSIDPVSSSQILLDEAGRLVDEGSSQAGAASLGTGLPDTTPHFVALLADEPTGRSSPTEAYSAIRFRRAVRLGLLTAAIAVLLAVAGLTWRAGSGDRGAAEAPGERVSAAPVAPLPGATTAEPHSSEPLPPEPATDSAAPAAPLAPVVDVPAALPRRPAPARGSLRLTANLRCEVWLDGRKVGRTPLSLPAVAPGAHRLRLVASPNLGTVEREFSIRVPADGRVERNVEFGTGKLVVRAMPWADVTVNGRSVGQTPFPPLTLYEGQHEIVLENSDLGARKAMTVSIQPGQRRDLQVRMDEPG
ncbi:MAG: serine/threonine protein kinase [Myxococcales bacterium]|nr:serine/threonine protein kinase [Myxococcales bacterium]